MQGCLHIVLENANFATINQSISKIMKKNLIPFATLIALLVMVGCGDKDESDGIEDPPVLESTTPFSYDKRNNEYIVNIEAEGGEYVFRAPKNTITSVDYIWRNETRFQYGSRDSFQNEYLTIKLEDFKVITISIVPNNDEAIVTYKMTVCGLDSNTHIVFHQKGRK